MAKVTLAGAALACALIGAALYLNTLSCGFAFDDKAVILDNQDIRPNVSWSNVLLNDYWGTPMSSSDSHKSYRPLTVATFRLNYMLHELQPLGYHLVNVLLHSAVCYLYVLLCGVVFSEVWPALIAGLLFAVHPIHTEAVSGLVGRADVLSGLFLLGSIFTYRQVTSSGRILSTSLLLTLILVLCSALSKEIGITAVALCLAYELLIHRKMSVGATLNLLGVGGKKSASFPQWFRSLLIHTAIFGCFTVTFLYLRVKLNKTPPLFSGTNNPALKLPTPYRQLHWSYLCVLNLWLLLSPSQLCAEYAMDTIPPISSLTDPRNLLTLATFAALISMLCYGMSGREGQRRRVLFGLCVMVIPFIPASNLFFPVGFVIAERVLYIPSMGFCMLVGYGAWHSSHKHVLSLVMKAGLIYLLLVHGLKTYTRNLDWYDSYSIYLAAVRMYPNNAKMWGNLGIELDQAGNRSDAEVLFNKAIDIAPNYTTGYMNLGYILKEEKRFEEAIEVYRTAAKLITIGLANPMSPINVTPKNVKVYTALANMLREHTTSYQEAYELTKHAVKNEPEWEESHNMMGNCLMKLERYSEAKAAFKRSLKVKPDYAIAHSNLGNAHQELGELAEAEECYREALRLNRNHTLTKFRLAKLIIDRPSKTLARLLEADAMLEEVIEEDPGNGNATFSRGLIHYDLKNYTLTEELFLQTLEMTPDDPGTLYNLGVLYSEQGRQEDSIQHLQQLLQVNAEHVSGQAQLATCYMRMKDYERARELFNHVLDKSPDDLMALQNYGIMLIEMKQLEESLPIFNHLIELYPEEPSYKKQVGIIQKHLENQRRKRAEDSGVEEKASKKETSDQTD